MYNIYNYIPYFRFFHHGTRSTLKLHETWAQKTKSFLNSTKLKNRPPKNDRYNKYAFILPFGCGLVTLKLKPKAAFCAPKVKHSRLVESNGGGTSNSKFDWKQFFQMLLPEIWYLLAAVIVSSLIAISYKYRSIYCTCTYKNSIIFG